MSQCYLKVDKSKNPEVKDILVGWDRPMQTYFAHVFGEIDERGYETKIVSLWQSSKEEVAKVIRQYADTNNDYTREVLNAVMQGKDLDNGHNFDQRLNDHAAKSKEDPMQEVRNRKERALDEIKEQEQLLEQHGNPFKTTETGLKYIVDKMKEIGLDSISMAASGGGDSGEIYHVAYKIKDDADPSSIKLPIRLLIAGFQKRIVVNGDGTHSVGCHFSTTCIERIEVFEVDEDNYSRKTIDRLLNEVLETLLYNVLDGCSYDWYNNEGGEINLTIDIPANHLEYEVLVNTPTLVEAISMDELHE